MNNELDLDERLLDYFQAINPDIMLGHVPESGQVSLLQDPGSSEIGDAYFNGNKPMAMNYEISCCVDSYIKARQMLSPLANAIAKIGDETLVSSSNSFVADHAEITGYPFNQLIDTAGDMYWTTTFVVHIDRLF